MLAAAAGLAHAQTARRATTRPVLRGREYAVSSMKPEATQVAERILRAGGNAFDAAVAGQAGAGSCGRGQQRRGRDAQLLL